VLTVALLMARDRLPAVLATAGLHDPRVAFWEPLKWMQTLRYNRRMAILSQQQSSESDKRGSATGDIAREEESELPPLLLKMDLEAGHFSASDRYNHLRELAFGWSFLIDRLQVKSSAVLLGVEPQARMVAATPRGRTEDGGYPNRTGRIDL
jgi:prolyl oligopeptidase PreP (S9A serine peptidase family)